MLFTLEKPNRLGVSSFSLNAPAFFNVLSMTQNAELHSRGIHDNVTECHTDHVVIIVGADADAFQVGQGHHQLISGHRTTTGVLPVVLKM